MTVKRRMLEMFGSQTWELKKSWVVEAMEGTPLANTVKSVTIPEKAAASATLSHTSSQRLPSRNSDTISKTIGNLSERGIDGCVPFYLFYNSLSLFRARARSTKTNVSLRFGHFLKNGRHLGAAKLTTRYDYGATRTGANHFQE